MCGNAGLRIIIGYIEVRMVRVIVRLDLSNGALKNHWGTR
jgi:hypothetical protein